MGAATPDRSLWPPWGAFSLGPQWINPGIVILSDLSALSFTCLPSQPDGHLSKCPRPQGHLRPRLRHFPPPSNPGIPPLQLGCFSLAPTTYEYPALPRPTQMQSPKALVQQCPRASGCGDKPIRSGLLKWLAAGGNNGLATSVAPGGEAMHHFQP